eukprot:11054127-Alexandrium_andersonii.AAC.1
MDKHKDREHELFKSICDKSGIGPMDVPDPEEATGALGPSGEGRPMRGRSVRRSASRARDASRGERSRSRPPTATPAPRGPFLSFSALRFPRADLQRSAAAPTVRLQDEEEQFDDVVAQQGGRATLPHDAWRTCRNRR